MRLSFVAKPVIVANPSFSPSSPVTRSREPPLALRPDSHPLPRLPAYRTVILRTDATSGTERCKPYDESPSSTLEEAGPAAIPVYPALRAGWYPPRGLPCRRYLHGHRPPVVAHRPLLSGAIGRCLGVVPGRATGAPPRRRRCGPWPLAPRPLQDRPAGEIRSAPPGASLHPGHGPPGPGHRPGPPRPPASYRRAPPAPAATGGDAAGRRTHAVSALALPSFAAASP